VVNVRSPCHHDHESHSDILQTHTVSNRVQTQSTLKLGAAAQRFHPW